MALAVVQPNFVTIGQMMQNAKQGHVRAWWYSKNCLFPFQKEIGQKSKKMCIY
jgi:hypothetical protein